MKWLNLRSGILLISVLVIIAVGIAYAVEIQREVSGSVVIGRIQTVGETILLWDDAPPTGDALAQLGFGTADVNAFGLFREPSRIPAWVENGSDITFELRVEAADVRVNGNPTGDVLALLLGATRWRAISLPRPRHINRFWGRGSF